MNINQNNIYVRGLLIEKTIDNVISYELENNFSRIFQLFAFEYNNQETRDSLSALIFDYLSQFNLIDLDLVCDETNNNPDIVDNNICVLDFYFKHPKTKLPYTYNIVCRLTGGLH